MVEVIGACNARSHSPIPALWESLSVLLGARARALSERLSVPRPVIGQTRRGARQA